MTNWNARLQKELSLSTSLCQISNVKPTSNIITFEMNKNYIEAIISITVREVMAKFSLIKYFNVELKLDINSNTINNIFTNYSADCT